MRRLRTAGVLGTIAIVVGCAAHGVRPESAERSAGSPPADREPSSSWEAKACPLKSPDVVELKQKDFCLKFAADFFYRLRHTHETLTYHGRREEQTYERPEFSTIGTLVLLAQIENESEWGSSAYTRVHNFWGLSARGNTAMRFPNFEEGLAYYFNHMSNGIYADGSDRAQHRGWPEFLRLLAEERITSTQVNRTLNSGPWCDKFPAYNVGRPDSCPEAGKNRNGQCRCVDYGGALMFDINWMVPICLKAFRDAAGQTVKSIIYPQDPEGLPTQLERRAQTAQELEQFAVGRCLQ